jgi:hypothetical protein
MASTIRQNRKIKMEILLMECMINRLVFGFSPSGFFLNMVAGLR